MTSPGPDSRPRRRRSSGLPMIPGRPIDPPPKDVEATAVRIDERHPAAGLVFRITQRFLYARAPLLAAGTTYFLFLSLISLVAFAYGLVALIGAEQLAEWLTEALDTAFPGLLGPGGISPESIRNYGTASSVLGLVVLAYSGTASVHAASQSMHFIFGAPKDPRNFLVARLRMAGQMMVLGPLILVSLVPSVVVSTVLQGVSDRLGLTDELRSGLVVAGSAGGALLLDFLVIYLMLSWFGGIRPARWPRAVGAAVGAVVIELLKYGSAAIIAWSLARPQYGAFAVPITLMLVLFLLSTALYATAALTAELAIRHAGRAAGSDRPAHRDAGAAAAEPSA